GRLAQPLGVAPVATEVLGDGPQVLRPDPPLAAEVRRKRGYGEVYRVADLAHRRLSLAAVQPVEVVEQLADRTRGRPLLLRVPGQRISCPVLVACSRSARPCR